MSSYGIRGTLTKKAGIIHECRLLSFHPMGMELKDQNSLLQTSGQALFQLEVLADQLSARLLWLLSHQAILLEIDSVRAMLLESQALTADVPLGSPLPEPRD